MGWVKTPVSSWLRAITLIHINVGKAITKHPFGNGKHTTYFW